MKPNRHPRIDLRRGLVAVTLAGLLLLPAASAVAQGFAPGKVRFEDVVPADCYFYASFAGLDACEKSFDGSGLYQTWREPEVQEFVRGTMEMIRQQLAQAGTGGVPFEELRAALQGRVGIAFGDTTLVGMIAVVPNVLISVDVGNRKEQFVGLLEGALSEVERQFGPVARERIDYQGVVIHSVPCPKLQMTSLCFAYLDNLFVAGINRYYVQKAIDNWRQPGRALSASASFKRSVGRAGSDPLLGSVFVNFEGMKSKLRPLAPPEMGEIADRLGILNVHSWFMGWTASGKGYRDFWYLDAPGEKKGLVKILSPGPVSPDALRFAPYNTVYFLNFNLDLAAAVEEVLSLTDLFFPPARAKFDGVRAQVRQHLGFDLHDDLLASLGQGVSLSVSLPSTGGLVPEILATINLKDPARFEKCLTSVVPLLGGEMKTLTFDGRNLNYLSLARRDVPFSLSPTYTIEGNTLYLAGAPLVLKEAIRNRTQEGKSLADNPGYQEVAAKVAKSPSSIEFIDLPRGVALLYATAAPFLQGLQGKVNEAGLPLDLALMPTTEALTRHLSAMVSTYSVDSDGMLSQAYSPIGCGAILGVLAKVVNSLEGVPPIGPVVKGMAKRMGGRPGGGIVVVRPEGEKAAADTPQAVFQRAFEAHSAGRYDEAIAGFTKAAEMGFVPSTCYYNIACGHSLKGEKDLAFEWLEKALKAGFNRNDLLQEDSDLDPIRDDPRFAKIMEGRMR